MSDNSAQIEYWNGPGAERWVGYQADFDRLVRPFGQAALDLLSPQPGERILDIGCGAGETTLKLGERVGPRGEVVGLDVSAPLLELARRQADKHANVRFVLGDAATARFATPFDALFSRFGVMFFSDPVAAFQNLRGALAPSARVAFACWRSLAENPWSLLALEAVRPILPDAWTPPQPDAPGPFAFADPKRVEGVLRGAGFERIVCESHEVPVVLSTTGLDAAADLLLRVGPASRLLADRDAATMARARDAVLEALRRTYSGPDVVMSGRGWLVSARTPA
jgi:SAM-dependent methyltransferase